jgi:hypothetical protein
MAQRTAMSMTREAGATVGAMLLALGATAVMVTLLALAVAAIMAVISILVAGLPLAGGRSPSGRSTATSRQIRCYLTGRSGGYRSSGMSQ